MVAIVREVSSQNPRNIQVKEIPLIQVTQMFCLSCFFLMPFSLFSLENHGPKL